MTAALKLAAHGGRQPSAEIYTVTPTVAKRWLSRNVRNRKIRPSVVSAYARDMGSGGWRITGEAIKFDTNGALADGQHRLAAVVESGTSVPMFVIRGVEPDAQTVMDSGVKRTISDSLGLGGVKNPHVVAAAARFALREPAAGLAGSGEVRGIPTNTEIAEFISDNPAIHDAAEVAQHYYNSGFDAPPSVLAIAWMRLSQVDVRAAGEFYSSIAEYRTDGAGDPRQALIRRLASLRGESQRVKQYAYLSLIFRAWNAWRTGATVSTFQVVNRQGDPVTIPHRLR